MNYWRDKRCWYLSTGENRSIMLVLDTSMSSICQIYLTVTFSARRKMEIIYERIIQIKIDRRLNMIWNPWKKERIHLWDIKIPQYIGFWYYDIFNPKGTFFSGGNLEESPQEATYSNIVSWDTVPIILNISTINELYVIFFDIGNDHLNYEIDEKV